MASTTQKDIGRLEGKVDSIITMIGDIQGATTALRNDFMEMEKGRLTQLEVKFATIESQVSTSATNTAKNAAMVWGIVASVVASVIAALLIRFILG